MKELAAVVFLLVVAGGAGVIWSQVQAHRRRHAPWHVEEVSDGVKISVYASREGAESLLIGTTAVSSPDFENRLWELREEGRERAITLNARNE